MEELQNTVNILLLINPNEKRNVWKYLMNPETINTANY